MLAVVLLVVVIALAAGVLAARPTLDDTRSRADARWAVVRRDLTPRYAAASGLALVLIGSGAGDRAVTHDLARDSSRWTNALRGHDVAAQVEIANRLEGEIARARQAVGASARLHGSQKVADALAAADRAAPPAAAVSAYEDAARRYQRTREQAWRRVVAAVLGYRARPTFQPAPPPS